MHALVLYGCVMRNVTPPPPAPAALRTEQIQPGKTHTHTHQQPEKYTHHVYRTLIGTSTRIQSLQAVLLSITRLQPPLPLQKKSKLFRTWTLTQPRQHTYAKHLSVNTNTQPGWHTYARLPPADPVAHLLRSSAAV
jgi:hypothetical protein